MRRTIGQCGPHQDRSSNSARLAAWSDAPRRQRRESAAAIILGMTVRERLLGAWTLHDFVEAPVDGSPDARPLGDHPRGTILYSADGFVSAQAAQPVSDLATDASSGLYLAYSGPFDVDEDTAIVRHHLQASLNPELVGSIQRRQVSFGDDGSLSLNSLEAISLGGRLVVVRVVWLRGEQ
jgi:hypothetical protein